MKRKGAIGLSMNTIVILIISLVILGGGINFLYSMIAGAEQIKLQLDEKTEAELERLLFYENQQVAISNQKATIMRGEQFIFGIGIINVGKEIDPKDNFNVEISEVKLIQPGLAIESVSNGGSFALFNDEEFLLGENENRRIPILIKIPNDQPKGTYIFSIQVYRNGGPYKNIQKLYIEAK